MEQIIEEYGISAILLVMGAGMIATFGNVLNLIAGM